MKVSSKTAITRKKQDIKVSLQKAGIRTLQDVLNTTVLSEDAKIKHIRHTYTCYDKYLKSFYRNNLGIDLRKELNNFILELVRGTKTIAEFKAFNKEIKDKIQAADEAYVKEQSLFLTDIPFEQTLNYTCIKGKKEFGTMPLDPTKLALYDKFSEKEKEALTKLHLTVRCTASEKYKQYLCESWLESIRTHWKDVYKNCAKNNPENLNRYLVEIYLENRNKDFYPDDFSDLDFMNFKDITTLAKMWLFKKFEENQERYSTFINETLPTWIEFNQNIHEDPILKKIK